MKKEEADALDKHCADKISQTLPVTVMSHCKAKTASSFSAQVTKKMLKLVIEIKKARATGAGRKQVLL